MHVTLYPTRCKAYNKHTPLCHVFYALHKVAAYDFILPVLINGYKAPTPPPSPWPPSNDPYRSSLAPKVSHHIPTPARRVLATVLKPLLDISTDNVSFEFSASDLETGGTKTQVWQLFLEFLTYYEYSKSIIMLYVELECTLSQVTNFSV